MVGFGGSIIRVPHPLRCLVSDQMQAATSLLMDGFSLLPVRPVRVDFNYPQPEDTSALADCFRAPLYFNQPVSALYYDKRILEIPQVQVTTQVYGSVKAEFDAMLGGYSWESDRFTVGLYTAIRGQLPAGGCTVDRAAQYLNMSGRTLQRRLQERGTNFQQLLQEVKSNLALKYLEDSALNIIDIALLLGYADPTSFSSAFKAWHGKSPREFRRQEI